MEIKRYFHLSEIQLPLHKRLYKQPMPKEKANITDIAKKTGLSITTVSRVLNGKSEQFRISEKSQKIVKAAAKELNYVPNQYAANLRTGKSNTIALIIPSLDNPFFAGIASNINTEIRKHGYSTIIADSDEKLDIEQTEFRQLISKNIEGIIIVPCGDQSEHIKNAQDQGLHVVCIDRYFENLDIPFVSTDNYQGAFAATKYLIENGHSSITCIQGVMHSTPNRLRVKGFQDALKEAGLESNNIAGDDFTFQNGYLETKLLLQQQEHPTAIFALSNTIAMGCMKALKEEDVRVPEDISIITFDDHPYLDYLSTPLSCVAQPVSDISKIAVKFLFSKIENKDVKTSQVLLKPTIKLRDSVRRIN